MGVNNGLGCPVNNLTKAFVRRIGCLSDTKPNGQGLSTLVGGRQEIIQTWSQWRIVRAAVQTLGTGLSLRTASREVFGGSAGTIKIFLAVVILWYRDWDMSEIDFEEKIVDMSADQGQRKARKLTRAYSVRWVSLKAPHCLRPLYT